MFTHSYLPVSARDGITMSNVYSDYTLYMCMRLYTIHVYASIHYENMQRGFLLITKVVYHIDLASNFLATSCLVKLFVSTQSFTSSLIDL